MADDFLNDVSQQRIQRMADDFIKTASTIRSALEAVVGLLYAGVPYYDWVGVYLLDDDNVLRLGPYRGDPSPHSEIRIENGICGAAAREGKSIIVDDVNADPRYLACSIKTKSEIVVPIIKDGVVKGEIDIDSDQAAAFSESDKVFLESIADSLARLL